MSKQRRDDWRDELCKTPFETITKRNAAPWLNRRES